MSSQKPILLYHANCPDGFGSAWAFHNKYKEEIEYLPLVHNNNLPFHGLDKDLFKDRIVWVADISFSRLESDYIHSIAKEFQIIDHHLSAHEALAEVPYAKINMEHSGAILSWQHCFPHKEPPALLSYIEDRDIWKWKMPHSQEVLTYIDSFDRDFATWYNLEQMIATDLHSVVKEGGAILRYTKNLRSLLIKNSYQATVAGCLVPVINLSFFKSEILHDLAEGHPFAAGYHFDGKNYIFSLRSRKEGSNVAEIAQKFGGGGHYHAAGFSTHSLALIA